MNKVITDLYTGQGWVAKNRILSSQFKQKGAHYRPLNSSDQWFSKRGPRKAATASPTPHLWNQKRCMGPALCLKKPFRGLWCTRKFQTTPTHDHWEAHGVEAVQGQLLVAFTAAGARTRWPLLYHARKPSTELNSLCHSWQLHKQAISAITGKWPDCGEKPLLWLPA